MSKHTQGPWRVKLQQRMAWDRYVPEHWVIKGPNNKHSPIALIRTAGLGAGPSMAVREANARLIAAAPDLLAALEGAYKHFLQHMERDWFDDDDQDVMQQMFDAINKSRGNPE